MATRLEIVEKAKWESAYGYWKPVDEEIQEFFTIAGLARPSKGELVKFRTVPGNIVINAQSIASLGIFITYALKKWGGLDVKWVSGSGIKGAGVNKPWNHDGMRAGDVA